MSAEHAAREQRRRRDFDAHNQPHDASSVSDSLLQTSAPSTPARARRRAVRPSERLQRYQRERLGQNARTPITDPNPPLARLSPASPALSTTERGERLRSKRRKLDDGTYDEEPQTFQYGFDGQVVPGQLRMQIVSCDGGEYSDPHVTINNYPQNILLDDTSVYCTKSNKCNLLLKHVGGMPFTLTKIVVKAPRAGFDAPIQEGLIFVSMDDDALLEKTSSYDVRWSPRAQRYSRHRGEGTRPSQEYLNPSASPLRSINRPLYLTDPPGQDEFQDPGTTLVPGFQVSVGDVSGEEDHNDPLISPRPWHDDDYSLRSYLDRYRPTYQEATANDRNDNLSATSSDSEGPMGLSSHDRPSAETERRQRRQLELQNQVIDRMRAQQIRDSDEYFGRRSRPPADHHDDDDDEFRFLNSRYTTPSRAGGRRTFAPAIGAPDPAYSGSSEQPPRLRSSEPDECNAAAKINRGEAGGPSSTTANAVKPHARFFISRSKSSTAINFDPPV